MATVITPVFFCVVALLAISDVHGCDEDDECPYGCCLSYCCETERDSYNLKMGLFFIIAAVPITALFAIACCYALWRRRKSQRIVLTNATVALTNPYHAGYDQPTSYRQPIPRTAILKALGQEPSKTACDAPPPYVA